MKGSFYPGTWVQNSVKKIFHWQGLLKSKWDIRNQTLALAEQVKHVGSNLPFALLRDLKMIFLVIGLIFLQVSLGQAQTPVDQNFDSQSIGLFTNTSTDIDGVRYTGGPGENIFSSVREASEVSPNPIFSGRAILIGNNVSYTGGYAEFYTINNSTNFKLVSLNIETYPESGNYATEYTIIGYDNGVQKVSVDVNMLSEATYGSGNDAIVYSDLFSNASGEDKSGLLTFGSSWENIDQVRFLMKTPATGYYWIGLDNIDFEPAVVLTGENCSLVSVSNDVADAYNYYSQSFTACQSGKINSIKLLSNATSSSYPVSTVKMTIRSGDGLTGSILKEIDFPTNLFYVASSLDDYVVFDVSAHNIEVTQGNQYTFGFEEASENQVQIYYSNNTPVESIYDGGNLYYNGSPELNRDLIFEMEFGPASISSSPVLSTNPATSLTSSGATLNGTISSEGGSEVTSRGFVYSYLDASPLLEEDYVTNLPDGTGTGSFSEAVTGLSPSTEYYYQAYATNSEGTSYGGVVSFVTEALSLYAGGTGTSDDPYQISDWRHLYNIRENISSHFVLLNDLDENSDDYSVYASASANENKGWEPIQGICTDFDLGICYDYEGFYGVFEGNGYSIKKLNINRPSERVGLFSVIVNNGEVKNLSLVDFNIIGFHGGSLAGSMINASGSKIHLLNTSISGSNHMGGLVGILEGGSIISECSSSGAVSGSGQQVGGLAGTVDNAQIINSYSSASISGVNLVGGLAGQVSSTPITNSYSTGNVIVTQDAGGGLIGYISGGSVENSYSSGQVSGSGTAQGGLIGNADTNPTFTNSFWDTQTSGHETSAGGEGKTTAEMKMQATFIGWNFTPTTGVWTIKNAQTDGGFSSYPYLLGFAYDEPNAVPAVNPIPGLEEQLYAGGSGTESDPYQISDWEHLHNVRENLSAYFILNNDLDDQTSGYNTYASATANANLGWLPIGTEEHPFTGRFDGNLKLIKGLVIFRTTTYDVGLFGRVTDGMVRNVVLINVSIVGQDFTGGIIGYSSNGILEASYVTGVITGRYQVGGLIGMMSPGTISNSFNNAFITGEDNTGGLVGTFDGGSIIDSYNSGDVYGGYRAGGLVAIGVAGGTITRAYSFGVISGANGAELGGLVGLDFGMGGITNSFWDIETSNQTISGGDGSVGKTTAEMKDQATFINWDFTPTTGTWRIKQAETDEGYISYPYLQAFAYDEIGTNPEINPIPGLETPPFAGGTGTETNPYQIENWEHLYNIRNFETNYFILNNNLNAASSGYEAYAAQTANSGAGWLPPSSLTNIYFDGKGYRIIDLFIIREDSEYIGLFGNLSNSTIKNLTLKDSNVEGANYTGTLAGSVFYSVFENVQVINAHVTSGDYYGGLLIGSAEFTNVINSSVDGVLSGENYIGGIVGNLYRGKIEESFAKATISGISVIGGLLGYNYGQTTETSINKSFARGTIQGAEYLGGLIGQSDQTKIINSYSLVDILGAGDQIGGIVGFGDRTELINVYATGEIQGPGSSVGGLTGGLGYSNPISNSFWDKETSGQEGNADGGTGLLTSGMKTKGTFTLADWDFENVWDIKTAADDDGYISYPYLRALTYDAPGDTPEVNPIPGLEAVNNPPLVTDENISISGATGAGGIFKIGDTITATWNNTAAGDNNSEEISSVTVDFSQFGGGAAVVATNNSGTWTATYTLIAGDIDAGNRNVSVSATNSSNQTTTTADTSNATVDNIAPAVSEFTPVNNATGVALKPTLTITFDDEVTLGNTGIFSLGKVEGDGCNITPIFEFDLSDLTDRSAFTLSEDKLSVTLTITENLPVNTQVILAIPTGFVTDLVGNSFVGFSASSYTWTFSTKDKNEQTITFDEIEGKTYGDATFTLGNAETDQGLTVTYTAADPTVVSITGNQATILKAGSTTIAATQDGDEVTFAAEPVERTLTVGKKTLTITANDDSKTYGETYTFAGTEFITEGLEDGDEVTSATLTSTGAPATAGVNDYDILISEAEGAGLSNYEITYVKGTLTVGKKALTITADDKQKTYGEANPVLTFSYTGLVNGDTKVTTEPSISTTATQSSNVGTYPITLSGGSDENYEITLVNGTLTIGKKDLTITADDKQKTYGEANPTLTFTYTGLVNGDEKVSTEPSISTTATQSSNVGTYPITLSGGSDDNYTITLVNGTLTIGKKDLTITADDKQKTYGEANPALTFSYTGLVNGDTKVTTEPSISTTATQSSNVGTYPITLTGGEDQNYTITLINGTLTIGKKGLTITADDKSKTYGEANPALTFTYTGLVSGDTKVTTEPSISTTATQSSNVGTYPITLSGGSDDNYTITLVNGTLTIGKKDLTITADDKQKTYGEANPILTFSYSGLVNGDTKVSTEPSISTTALASSNVGTYPITLSGGSDENYTITLVNGTLTIGKKAVTITAEDKQKTYGEANPALTFSYSGLVNGDTKVTTEPSISTTATQSSNVGTYPITLTGGEDQNYTITLVNGTLTIGKKDLTITADDKQKTYGEANPILTFTYTGLVNGDTKVTTEPSISTTATASSNAGTYPITLTGGEDQNYTVTLVNGTLTVGKATLKVQANAQTKIFGSADPVLTFVATGFKGTDNLSVLTGNLVRAAGEQVGKYAIGLGTLTATNNYLIEFTSAQFEIIPAELIAISNPDPITTPWSVSPTLPAKVTAVTADGQVVQLAVSWNLTPLNVFKRGAYFLTGVVTLPSGILNPGDLKATLEVRVLAKPAPQDVTLSNDDFDPDPKNYFQVIGNFTVIDPIDNVHTITLVPGAGDNQYFEVKNGILFWSSAEEVAGRTQFTVVIRVTDRDGNQLEKTFTINLGRTDITELEVFNSFTPNGDGINDTWGVPDLRYFRGVRVQVFDRNGERLFYTEDADTRWDGTYQGKEMPVGTYFWVVEVIETGNVRRGILTILKK
jgi:gliding motility-associated-like protein